MEQLSIRSFLHHGHPYHLYLYDPVEAVPEGATILRAETILPREQVFTYRKGQSYAGFANVFAYKALWEHGGYWADCDMICLKPLTFSVPYLFPAERLQDGSSQVNNCLMKVPPGSEVMRRAWLVAGGKDSRQLEWGETGPHLITQLVRDLGLREYVAPPVVFCPVDYWEWWRFRSDTFLGRLKLRRLITRRTHAVHLWNEMWRRNKVDKDAPHSPRSFYGQLQKRYMRAGRPDTTPRCAQGQ